MNAIFGERTLEILQGNQKVDLLAKDATTQPESTFPDHSPFMDQFLLVSTKQNLATIADGHTRGFLTARLQELQDCKLTTNNLLRIAWTRSAHPASFHVFSKDYHHEHLRFFAYKVAQGRLPTKDRISGSTSQCPRCQEEEETNEHVMFHCNHYSELRSNTIRKVTKLLLPFMPNSSIPCWFLPLKQPQQVQSITWLPQQDPVHISAAAGAIPRKLAEQHLAPISSKWLEDLHLIILREFHAIWKTRCQTLSGPSTPAPPPTTPTNPTPKEPKRVTIRRRKTIFTIEEPSFVNQPLPPTPPPTPTTIPSYRQRFRKRKRGCDPAITPSVKTTQPTPQPQNPPGPPNNPSTHDHPPPKQTKPLGRHRLNPVTEKPQSVRKRKRVSTSAPPTPTTPHPPPNNTTAQHTPTTPTLPPPPKIPDFDLSFFSCLYSNLENNVREKS